ncbi:RagB/SusD family nutrient uptake outer membrane protein [Pedobacter arcticus]|uniref:RagB/SusD family nutrient uptake outer membrane protein n=1 Tax=Pedobacter arcticus TaxID=752140 RepID=UPI00031D079F|nr:RagB/SusD family nutrient uptake outer membrane protein [Pedobacter arcticus]
MKHISKTLAVLILFIMGSCKDILETTPKDFLDPEEYYTKEEHIKSALTGVYAPLGTEAMYHLNLIGSLTNANDEVLRSATSGTGLTGTMVYNYSASDAAVSGLWDACYLGINRANTLLANIDKPQMDEILREQYRGEALFLRGYYYFVLVDNWGGVPLRLIPSKSSAVNVNMARSSVGAVYDQIIKDMTAAESLVAKISTLGFSGRISKTAVQGILARVNLTMAGFPLKDESRYAEAAKWTSKVINSGEHALNNDYRQIFINHTADIYDIKECIWEIEAYGNNNNTGAYQEGSWLSTFGQIISTDLQNPGYGYGAFYATAKLYNLYDATDYRRDWCISPFRYNGSVKAAVTTLYNRFPGKWRREYEPSPKSKNFGPTNIPMLRYSDILLMRAEAITEMKKAADPLMVDTVNLVRKRGYGTFLFGDTLNRITVTNQGVNYSAGNMPVITISGGGGTGAAAVAVLTGDKISAINITSGGKFYTSAPTITITVPTGGTGSNALATATITAVSPNLSSAKTASYTTFIEAIKEERSRELCYEVLRNHDLKRWGIFITRIKEVANEITISSPTIYPASFKFLSRAGDNIDQRHQLFPIPASELSLNKLATQNPGW